MTAGLRKTKIHKGVIVNNSTAPAQRGKAHDFILMKRNLIWKWTAALLNTVRLAHHPCVPCKLTEVPGVSQIRTPKCGRSEMRNSLCTQALPSDSGSPSHSQVHSLTTRWRLPWPPDLKCKPTPFPLSCFPLSFPPCSLSSFLHFPAESFPKAHFSFCHTIHFISVRIYQLSLLIRKFVPEEQGFLFLLILFTAVYKLPNTAHAQQGLVD